MGNLILAAVADKNGHLYLDCSPLNLVPLNCDLVSQAQDGWLVPTPNGQAYEFFMGGDQSAVGGAVQSFKLIQGTDTYILLGTVADFQAACNACCDASPSLSPVPHDAVPGLMFGAPPNYILSDCNCVPYFYGLLPPDETETILETDYKVEFWCGGTLIHTTANVTTQAAALADMIAAAAAYGTWTVGTGGLLTLANTGTICDFAAIRVIRDTHVYTIDLTVAIGAGSTFNQYKSGGYLRSVPLTTITSNTQVKAVLDANVTDGSLATAAGDVINYTGTGNPQGLYLNGVLVTAFTEV